MVRKYRRGLLPPRPESVRLQLKDFFDPTVVLPQVPAVFGHVGAVSEWGMLGNGPDSDPADVPVGDCAFAGPEHVIMGWNAAAGKPVPQFTYASTIAAYSAVTGYDPSKVQPDGSNPSDQGGDMTQIATWWESTGFTDANGQNHKIVAHLALTPGDLDQFTAAAYLFEAVGVGLALPASADDQFEAGQAWSVQPGDQIEGGHFVPVLGRVADGNFQVITWGAAQEMTPAYYQTYGQLGIVYLTEEFVTNGRSPEGFDMDSLQDYLIGVHRL